jgi:hypothetical protein
MMKPFLLSGIWISLGALGLAEPQGGLVPPPEPVVMPSSPPRAWLGLKLAKPDEMVAAQVPSLPPGVGFIVKSVEKGGPAEVSGLCEMDLLWKLGDQMLINEAQLATLLRLSNPGDEVVLSGFRGGKPMEVTLKLGESTRVPQPFPGEMVESAILPGISSGPMRVVNLAEKSANFTTDEGSAVVRKEGSVFKVKIHGQGEVIVFEGDITSESDFAKIPLEWQTKARVLCRTLEQALDGSMIAPRQPRPRVVLPAAGKP